MTTLMLLAAFAAHGKPKDKPPAMKPPSAEIQAALTAFSASGTTYMEAYRKADVSGIQGIVWQIGSDGAPFQPRVDALKAKYDAAEGRMLAANAAVNAAMQASDAAGIKAAGDALLAEIAGVAAMVAEADALRAEVTAAAVVPPTIALADVVATPMEKLQRIFATAGWSKEGAAIMSMKTTGYNYENFDVARDGKVLSVQVIRPDASATGTGGAKPKDVAARNGKDVAFRYHAATDGYVEIKPGDGATPADAQALLAQVITP